LTALLRLTLRRAVSAAVAATTARGVAALPPLGGEQHWRRTNHRGESVTLWQGPAVVIGTFAGLATAPGLTRSVRLGALSAVAASGALGAYDDQAGSGSAKGLGGHLASLRRGEVTSGAVKVVGIGLSGLLAGAAIRRRRPIWEQLAAGALVAGSANLVNLLDLRPGRATKAVLLAGAPALATAGVGGSIVSAPLAASIALLPDDLAERSMMGDSGANALGSALGCAGAAVLGRRSLVGALGGVVALTLLSERVSFTKVIESTPVLRELDAFGRRPVS